MRFAILGSRGYPSTYGGFETFVRHLAEYLRDRGHAVTVYGRSAGLRFAASDHGGVRSLQTPGVDSKALSTASHGATAALHAMPQRYDAALMVNVANAPVLPLLELSRTPVLVNVDGIEWERAKWGPLARRLFFLGAKMAAWRATELVADSRAIAARWSREFGVRPTYIPYGAEVHNGSAPAERVAELGLDPGSYALVVARLAPENHVDLTLDALERLEFRVPSVVVGDANYRSDTEERLRRLDDAGRVRWLGHVADPQLLTALWRHCAVYVHGHSVGGTNPALLQALGCGAPTLALDTPYNREVVEHGDCARLYPRDPATLAGLIDGLVGAEELRAALGRGGQQVVGTHYRWADVCARYEERLIALAGGARRRRRARARADR